MVSWLKNGGGLLMDCLIALGGTKGFGVPGESYLAVLDAMYDRRDKFDLMLCRNEGGAAGVQTVLEESLETCEVA